MTTETLTVCVDPKVVHRLRGLHIAQPAGRLRIGVDIEDGLRAGVGHNNTAFATKFDDFWMKEEYGTRHTSDCPLCDWCYCEGELLPFTLLATIQGNDDCDTLDGISCVLTGLSAGPEMSGTGLSTTIHALTDSLTLACGLREQRRHKWVDIKVFSRRQS